MANLFKFNQTNYFNISETVGIDGVNLPDDVYLVQALLRELYLNSMRSSPLAIAPIPTGVFNNATAQAIEMYKQVTNKMSKKYPLHKNPFGALEGVSKLYYKKHINPIQGSIFAFGTNHRWAIAQMQEDLFTGLALNNNFDGVASYLYDKYPKMLFMFRD
jgi:hypothetical protein